MIVSGVDSNSDDSGSAGSTGNRQTRANNSPRRSVTRATPSTYLRTRSLSADGRQTTLMDPKISQAKSYHPGQIAQSTTLLETVPTEESYQALDSIPYPFLCGSAMQISFHSSMVR